MKIPKGLNWVLALLPLILLGIMTAVFAGKSLHRNPEVQTQAVVGKPVPARAAAPLDGGAPLNAAQAAGGQGPYLVNFFGSWCGPCIAEMPVLMDLKAKGVRIVGVAYKDTPDAANVFLARHGDPYVAKLNDPDASLGIEFGVSGVPETFLVGANGKVLAKASLPLNARDAERLMAQLSKDTPS